MGRPSSGRRPAADPGGVRVPCDFGLEGHSDADVLAHAITDAILGAAALGDIGMHFPDTDPRWKGCDSLVFLRHAKALMEGAGFRIVNVDSTVVLERPKLKDYRQAIREKLAETLDLDTRPGFGEVQDGREGGAGGRRPFGGSAGDCDAGAPGVGSAEHTPCIPMSRDAARKSAHATKRNHVPEQAVAASIENWWSP